MILALSSPTRQPFCVGRFDTVPDPLDLMLDIQKRLGLSFIFISHDISVVRYFCDRVAVMHKGRIVEAGDAEKICTDPGPA